MLQATRKRRGGGGGGMDMGQGYIGTKQVLNVVSRTLQKDLV